MMTRLMNAIGSLTLVAFVLTMCGLFVVTTKSKPTKDDYWLLGEPMSESERLEQAQEEYRNSNEYQDMVHDTQVKEELERAKNETQFDSADHKQLRSLDGKWIVTYGHDGYRSAGSGRDWGDPDHFEPYLTLRQTSGTEQDEIRLIRHLTDMPIIKTASAAAFSPDSKLLVTSMGEWGMFLGNSSIPGRGLTQLWDVDRQELLHTLSRDGSIAETLVFSPDGSKLVVGESDYRGTVTLFDVNTRKKLWSINPGFERPCIYLNKVAFTPNGRYVLAGGIVGGDDYHPEDVSTWLRRIDVRTGMTRSFDSRFTPSTEAKQLPQGIGELRLSVDGKEATIIQEGLDGQKKKTIRIRI